MPWIKQVTNCTCRKPISIIKSQHDAGSIWQCPTCDQQWIIKKWDYDYRESWPVWEKYTEPF